MNATEKYNRIRPLKIWEILKKETDEDHPMPTEVLRAKLREHGIDSHRTTIYADIELLNESGYEVMCRRGKSNLYYVMDRSFSNPEIHILMDAVQAASFITEKKTEELVDKIAELAGSQRALVLKNNIVSFNDAKSTNESIYYNVNTIIDAINVKKKIIFLYFDYDINHNKVYRREGHHFVISPLATVFANGNYYVLSYYPKYGTISHYRVDRMEKVDIIEDSAEFPPKEMHFNVANYKKQLFGMFSGETTAVSIELHNSLIDVVFDLFGDDTKIVTTREDIIRITVDVQVSDLFFGWCSSFGDKVRIVEPNYTREQYLQYVNDIPGIYNEEN